KWWKWCWWPYWPLRCIVQPGQDDRPAGATAGGGAEGVDEASAVGRQPVEVRGADLLVAVAAGVGAVVVGHDWHHVPFSSGRDNGGDHQARDDRGDQTQRSHGVSSSTEKRARWRALDALSAASYTRRGTGWQETNRDESGTEAGIAHLCSESC